MQGAGLGGSVSLGRVKDLLAVTLPATPVTSAVIMADEGGSYSMRSSVTGLPVGPICSISSTLFSLSGIAPPRDAKLEYRR